MVVLESAPMPRVELPGLALELVELDDGGSPFDLSVLLTEAGGAVSGALRYSTALFDAATIAALAADLTTALEVIADQPEATLPALAATLAERARTRRRAGAESLDASRAARLGRLQPRSAAGAGSRAAAASSPASWIQFEPLLASGALPCLARPARPGIDLAGWISDHRDQVQSRIHQHGAVLFRGFGVTTAADFDRAIAAVSEAALPYTERSSPRSSVAGNIYTSTDHPADQHIFLHNEQSYNLVFPLRIFFCCVTAAQSGGETPLADSRRVFQRIAPAVRERFLAQGYQYVRSFHPHFGLSWQDAFQTTDPAVVDAYCRAHEIEVEWRSGSRLRTRQRRRAAGIHPVTGEATWFNHATFFHVSTLPPAVSAMLLAQLGEDELPNQTYYGDGTPIEPEVIEALRDAYRAETVMFPWQAGDVLAVDNMLVAHGRTPFTGPRRVLAGMAQPVPWAAIAPARTATE
jgi:alpha-ketoglutarate-dependent taurine dioxygenase